MDVKIGEKTYVLEYTRNSICKAEEAFGISMLNREPPSSVKELTIFLKALLYGALVKNKKGLKVEDMEDIYDEFTGENGYEQEGLIEGLVEMLAGALNPAGGGRKKKLL